MFKIPIQKEEQSYYGGKDKNEDGADRAGHDRLQLMQVESCECLGSTVHQSENKTITDVKQCSNRTQIRVNEVFFICHSSCYITK